MLAIQDETDESEVIENAYAVVHIPEAILNDRIFKLTADYDGYKYDEEPFLKWLGMGDRHGLGIFLANTIDYRSHPKGDGYLVVLGET
ncbi:hypothetical protein [Symmachiella dynata]|uniref:hypothetical protein n=1 Tax=Symmachiella dynata TaxID=2527995 RepID=UPI0011A9D604|nr:hypothetical protein [Symmachiella dynata]